MSRIPKSINIEVGRRIKQRRQEQKLTREQLAELSGYSANFIQEVERGRSGLSSESIRAFSLALKVTSDYLLFGEKANDFDYLFARLGQLAKEKRKYVLKILEAAIDCAEAQDEA